ncbi:MAG TPA: histidine phosphatase family protein [Casimicrobiaceae bacterium]
MLIVSFLRHASTAWNEQGLMQGRRDVPLSASGRAEAAGWRLPLEDDEPAAWLASPLARAAETASIMSGSAPRLVPELIEMDWGTWEGQSLPELRARLGCAFTRNERRGLDFRPPGGESPRDVMTRVARWLDGIGGHDPGPLVAVTHNGVLRAMLALATGWDMTCKAPVKLRTAALHRFALARGPRLALLACNVPLVSEPSARCPSRPPPAPSAALR